MTALVEARGVTVRFGGVIANDRVDLDIGRGQLVGLIGPNGAGKTTFIDALTGFVPAEGSVHLDGDDIAGWPAHERARRGLLRTWQSIELFDDLTVGDNLAVAAVRPRRFGLVRELLGLDQGRAEATVAAALSRVGIAELADRYPSDLSQGQRKLVGVARGLVVDPLVLCLDEPAAGLDHAESSELGARLRALADDSCTMLLVDHDMSLVLGICDVVYVLEYGRVIARGAADEVRADPRVVEAYLGTAAETGGTP